MMSCLFPRYVPNLFPNYIRAPNGAEAKPVSQLYKGQSSLSYSSNVYNTIFFFMTCQILNQVLSYKLVFHNKTLGH